MYTMSEFGGVTIAKGTFAALLLSQCYLLTGCGVALEVDGYGDESWVWTEYTSEERPALTCAAGQAVQGIDCAGGFCDNVALYCVDTGWPHGVSTWLPHFSEEGSGTADEGRCASDMWMTGLDCQGPFCDNISMECSQMVGSTMGACAWSGWYSEEQPPFFAPPGYFIKAIECEGNFCDRKRYRYCQML